MFDLFSPVAEALRDSAVVSTQTADVVHDEVRADHVRVVVSGEVGAVVGGSCEPVNAAITSAPTRKWGIPLLVSRDVPPRAVRIRAVFSRIAGAPASEAAEPEVAQRLGLDRDSLSEVKAGVGATFLSAMVALSSIACGTLLEISPDDSGDAASDARAPESDGSSVEGAMDGSDAVASDAVASVDSGADAGLDAAPPQYVFVAVGYPNGFLGGLSGADDTCNMQAMNAGLPGTYKAWLSTASVSAVDRFGDGSWRRPDGVLVFASRQDIIAGKPPLHGIDRTAANVMTSGNVWTGTGSNGVTTGTTCDGWTAYAPGVSGTQGQIGTTSSTWTNATSQPCNNMGTYLCFGVP